MVSHHESYTMNSRMFRLYTSDTCPKGVLARQYLTKTNLAFTEVNIDQVVNHSQVDTLWQLLRNWREDPHTPLVLPVLTQTTSKEEIVFVGYDPQEWSDVLVAHEAKSPVRETSNMPLSNTSQSETKQWSKTENPTNAE